MAKAKLKIKRINNKSHSKTLLDELDALRLTLVRHNKHKSAYTWTGCSRSDGWEKSDTFEIFGQWIEAEQSYYSSNRNCYYTAGFYLNGRKKDIRIIKNAIKQIEELLDKRKVEYHKPEDQD